MKNSKTALITGISGQDGSYLAELLLKKDYKVFGLSRRYSNPNFSNLEYLNSKSPYAYYKDAIFFNEPGSPKQAIDNMITKVQKEDLNLVCLDEQSKAIICRYSEIYATVAGACLWNKLKCHDIYGYDLKHKKFVKLSTNQLE